MKQIKIYTTSWCPYCKLAKNLLNDRGLDFQEIDLEEKGLTRDELEKITGERTVPQIVVDDEPIGGYDDLLEFESSGELS